MTSRLKYFILCLALTATVAIEARDFESVFADSTLRFDYVFGGTKGNASVMVERAVVSPGWYGRRTRLDQLPLRGNGQITLTHPQTGDTLYRHSFSSLFQEWLGEEEALHVPRAFNNSFLMPMPRERVNVHVALFDVNADTMAQISYEFDPADELNELRGFDNRSTYRYLHGGGDPRKAIDVAILGEGYTADEMDKFYQQAQTAVEAILSHEPFGSRAADFNFIAVETPSAHSGVSVPLEKRWADTAFGSHFSTFHSPRYLTSNRVPAFHDALAGIPYEHIIVLANTDVYGGGGIYNAYTLTTAGHANFRPVVVHEFGHSFGGLADEYFYAAETDDAAYNKTLEPWEPNVTTLVDFGSKWQEIVPEDTPIPTPASEADKYPVGVFEGAAYSFKNIYRPADRCRMRDNQWPTFCPACVRSMTQLIDFYTLP